MLQKHEHDDPMVRALFYRHKHDHLLCEVMRLPYQPRDKVQLGYVHKSDGACPPDEKREHNEDADVRHDNEEAIFRLE